MMLRIKVQEISVSQNPENKSIPTAFHNLQFKRYVLSMPPVLEQRNNICTCDFCELTPLSLIF